MKKLLFFAESVSIAHIGRPLLLAEWANEQGFLVHFATGKQGVRLLHAMNSRLLQSEIYSISGESFYKRVNQGKFFYTTSELEKYVSADINVIQEVKPDFIISDFRLSTAISARKMQIPLINLSNAYWSPHYQCKFPAPPLGIFKWLPEPIKNNVFDLLRPIAFKTFGKPLNMVRKKHNLTSVDDFRTHYTAGDYTLYMDHPDFIPLAQPPFRHAFLGPVIWSPAASEKKLHIKKNSVYISMGSSGNNQILKQITKACLLLKLNMVISGLKTTEADQLTLEVPELKELAIIKPFVNAEDVLPNCKFTICHGGSGTVYQSLLANKPVLCFPQNPDQGLVSMAVKDGNWGSAISPSHASAYFISIVIEKLLNDQNIFQTVSQFNKKLKSYSTKNIWLQFLTNISNAPFDQHILEEIK